MEDFPGNGLVLGKVGGFAKLLTQFVASRKPPQKIPPVFFQAEHSVPGPAESGEICFQQLTEEGFQSRSRGSSGGQHTGITDQPSADHNGVYGKSCPEAVRLGSGEDSAAAADRIHTVFHGIGKPVLPQRPVIEILPHPWVENEEPKRIPVENFQQPIKFLRLFQSQPGLNADGDGGAGTDRVQKEIQAVGVRQHAAALSFGNHGAGGTPQVQVNLPVAQIRADLRRPEKVLRVFGHHLGNRQEIFLFRRGQLPGLPGGQAAVLGGGEKGNIVSGDAGKVFVMQMPVDGICQPLHGGKEIVHGNASLFISSVQAAGITR